MANTIPDIPISSAAFTNVNTLTGIVSGTALYLSNKSTSDILLQISDTQPASDSSAGEIMYQRPNATSLKVVTFGEATVWAKSLQSNNARISVQEAL